MSRRLYSSVRVAFLMGFVGGLFACSERVAPQLSRTSVDRDGDVIPAHSVGPASTTTSDAGVPVQALGTTVTLPADRTEDSCARAITIKPASGWTLHAIADGPTFRELVGYGRRGLIGVTDTRACQSEDGGLTWTQRAQTTTDHTLSLTRVGFRESWMIWSHPVSRESPVDHAWISQRGLDAGWIDVRWPAGFSKVESISADIRGRLFAATDSAVSVTSDDGATWSPPTTLPGTPSRDVFACGTLLLVRSMVARDWIYYRSFDYGSTWHPLRLGGIGLSAEEASLRCASARGWIEAGKGLLPAWMSRDGGHTWQRPSYDEPARRAARVLNETLHAVEEAPRCFDGSDGRLQCVDTNRTRSLHEDGTATELRGPEGCVHVRQVDSNRTYAFGPGCGLIFSPDRGGRWLQLLRSRQQIETWRAPGDTTRERVDGRGGFVSERVAWRLSGGLWWTRDAGRSWQPVFTHLGRTLEHGVFVDEARGVFATSQGWVVATSDGGRTWRHVMAGEIERISASGKTVIVTTTQTLRASPDGGVVWWGPGQVPRPIRTNPTVEIRGTARVIALPDGSRLVDDHDQLELQGSHAGDATAVIASQTRGRGLMAAWVSSRGLSSVLLDGGAILVRSGASAW